MVEWAETETLGCTRCTATVGDYALSIVGNGSEYVWVVWQQNRIVFQGMERSLASAKLTVEAVVRWAQNGPEGAG